MTNETATPRMAAACKEARGIEEGCKLEIELSALKAKLAAVEQDAARYSVVRDILLHRADPWQVFHSAVQTNDEMDAATDAAKKEKAK